MCVGSGIHAAVNGKIRPGDVRGLRTGDERHRGGAGDESRFPESVLITWVPDDWTVTPGAVFAVLSQRNSLS